jgi:hypothetical protein
MKANVEYKKIENKISKYHLSSRVLDDNIYAKCWGCKMLGVQQFQ